MEYITTKEASKRWGISTARITVLANEGRISGAQLMGRRWLIPANATKPTEIKANSYWSTREDIDTFSFPLYHFRPDLSYVKDKEEKLSKQQRELLEAETAVLRCRFKDAYPILESIRSAPDDVYIEIGSLWNAGLCCVAMNKADEFSKILLRLEMILSEDFPHRDDLVILLDALKTYVDTLEASATTDNIYGNMHEQCIPFLCVQSGYKNLSKEATNSGAADTLSMELHLHLLQSTSAVLTMEMMHFYLMGIYYLRQNMEEAQKHAEVAVKLAYENKYYFPLVTYYSYFAPILSSILSTYPEGFQEHCNRLISNYGKNFTAFLLAVTDDAAVSKLTFKEYPYICAVLADLMIADIADKMGVSKSTVIRNLRTIYEKLGVKSKQELKDYLHRYM